MRKARVIPAVFASALALTGFVVAGVPVEVMVTGEVEFNQIGAPPLGNVNPGDNATLTFVVDSDVFADSPNFPTRGYEIDQTSFLLAFDSAQIGLEDPFPAGQTPYFVIRDNDPAVDGFFTSVNLDFPLGVPLAQQGIFSSFINNYLVTYTGDKLPSLDILDALGTYDFDGLTVFNWTVDDGPFNALGIVFSQMTLTALEDSDEDGDGIPDDDDLCASTTIPESVPTARLGVNRWALVDGDDIFDTFHPQGNDPGFDFTLEQTGGCSCEQIIEQLGLGKGHEKFGCSTSAMTSWIMIVAGVEYTNGGPDTPESPDAGVLIDVSQGLGSWGQAGQGGQTNASGGTASDRLSAGTEPPSVRGTRRPGRAR